ncbi:hypothetical protein ABMA28_008114 [Loxostege sticticalis]|uniref:DDE Tnp4 domain-containing protein n=1 Tax=Loxostege sticticalis TaxID=481309 RepID=A0ABD0SGH6_LOXSC
MKEEVIWANFLPFSELRCYPKKFYDYTIMNIQTFDYILEKIRSNLEPFIFGKRIVTPEEKPFLTLRFLSTGISFRNLAFSFRLGKTTVRKIVYTTCTAIWSNLHQVHLPVPTVEILNKVADKYFDKWQFPNSLADADKRFLVIEVGGRGRQSDGGTTLPGSDVTLPMVIIDDEAYPLKSYLMRPYPQSVLNPATEIFNKRLSRARKCVECAFGILCAKWRILNKAIETNCKHARLIIKTTCLLHNIILDKDGSNDNDYSDITSNSVNETQRVPRNNRAGNLAINIVS